MAPKGGQEAQRISEAAFDQVSLASASFGADRDPTKAGIQLTETVPVEGVRHFHNGIGASQRYMTGRDGTLDSQISAAGRLMAREIFDPVVQARDQYVAHALAASGLSKREASHEKSIERIKDQSATFKEKFALAA